MLRAIFHKIINGNEKRLGVGLDYAHAIADANLGLLMRYGKIFGFLDPRKNVPADAYHIARLVGALSADCGTCVQAEINLAKNSRVDLSIIENVVRGDSETLSRVNKAVYDLSYAVTNNRIDDAEARDVLIDAFGESGVIELGFAMNGAALLPGVKRTMGYATACDISVLKMQDKSGS